MEFPKPHIAETDVLVLGGGGAGLRAALAARQQGKQVSLVKLGDGASAYLVALNAPFGHADPRDNPEVYSSDMIRGGYGLNERPLVQALAAGATQAVQELEAMGVEFARRGEHYLQRHLAGSTYPRSVYCTGGTGLGILRRLAERCDALGVKSWVGWKIFALLLDREAVVGALAIHPRAGELLILRAGAVVLAMGGIGQIYEDSTYPPDIGSDSYALAYSAGAKLIDMEFVQFEPTIVVYPRGCRGMEMPTAMLGDGAELKNVHGERFMFRYNPEHGEKRIEKAKMALCIQREINAGRGLTDETVLFDTTVMPPDLLESYHSHCQRLRAAGLEPKEEAPHVRPAAHSHMGGVYIDVDGGSGIPGLYVCGEAAGGIHGASRLAGNAGSEILVFGARAGRAAADHVHPGTGRDWKKIQDPAIDLLRALQKPGGKVKAGDVKSTVRKMMQQAAGIYRVEKDLALALAEMDRLEEEMAAGLRVETFPQAIEAISARNMVLVAQMILLAARERTESRGAHQRLDFPSPDDPQWVKHLALFRDRSTGHMRMEKIAVA